MVNWKSVSWRPRGITLALIVLSWLVSLHLSGLYLFTRGFLLTRLSLSNVGQTDNAHSFATHRRLVFLIIDALRFDFISPDAAEHPSPYFHNVLTLPAELTARYPTKSFIFNAFADPPTSTMQRIKGITTGSLPTFVDITSNFGASAIEEDSIILQLQRAGKRVAFMGDDTWTLVFPTLLSSNMSFPYDSFNVEDLHSVDEGVIRHIFPLLEDETDSWDVIFGHFLGVDHVGHRVGPDHPVMKAKLQQMDLVLRNIVNVLDDDTLLVVIGDHGMDEKGNHGGDSVLETSSAAWIYSKGKPLFSPPTKSNTFLEDLAPRVVFPGANVAHRRIQQIDLVSSLSLLLGLPIPFNNLGSVIPELFYRKRGTGRSAPSELELAMEANAKQVHSYLSAYRESASGGELDQRWDSLQMAWAAATAEHDGPDVDGFTKFAFIRYVLSSCRSLWAQFDVSLMAFGLLSLLVTVMTSIFLYIRLGQVTDWESWLSKRIGRLFRHTAGGGVVGALMYIPVKHVLPGVTMFEAAIFLGSLASCGGFLLDIFPVLPTPKLSSIPIPLILHTLAFMSNSFTFWEDRIVLFLLISSLAPSILTAITSPTLPLRLRIFQYAAIYALCTRLIGLSTVCREEQQPYCHVTFYASSSLPGPPFIILILIIPTSIALPFVIRRFLAISRSDNGIAPMFLYYLLLPLLLANNACWLLEWVESSEFFGGQWSTSFRFARTVLARCIMSASVIGAPLLWWGNPLCLEIQVQEQKTTDGAKKRTQASVLGFTNAYGAPYLLFWCISFAIVAATSQLTSQVVLAISAVALLAHLEVTDSVRDVKAISDTFANAKLSAALDLGQLKLKEAPFTFSHISSLALLAIHVFHGTGHQSTLQSLQMKSAFLLTPTVVYPFSLILVTLNTLGPHFLFALAAPLLACWQFSPLPQPASSVRVLGESMRACLGIMIYFSTLLVGSAASAAWLRRHLMVWKVFAPRFMSAAVGLLAVDVAVLFAVSVGLSRTTRRVGELFKKLG